MSRGDFVRGEYVEGGFCPTPLMFAKYQLIS